MTNFDYSAKAYEALNADGASPQLARTVLPNMIKTEVVVTATPEQWEALGDDVEVQDGIF